MTPLPLTGWIAALILPAAAYPLASVLLLDARRGASSPVTVLTALGLSAGLIALITFALGLIGMPLTALTISLPYALICIIGGLLWRRGGHPLPKIALPRSTVGRIALLIALITGGAALFNGLYWPFKTDDALGIYQPQAQQIYQTGALIPLTGADSLYRAYPMLVQFNYAYIYSVSGWEDEYAAKLIPTLLALSSLLAVWELARLIASERAGWLAVALLALTPAFARWASSGYVDLPMAAYYALAAVFCVHGLRGSARAALLSALWIGLAAWTKNAGLIGIGLWALTLLGGWLSGRIPLRTLIAAWAVAGVIAAPWYVRNLIGAGFLIPDTAWTDQAERTLETLLIYATSPNYFGVTGMIILAALAWGIDRLRQRRGTDRGAVAVILTLTLPFFAAWWLFASYDPRFTLLFTPILCALAGAFLADLIPPLPRSAIRALAAASVIAAVYIAFISVDYKDEMLRDPFMSHADKLVLVGRQG